MDETAGPFRVRMQKSCMSDIAISNPSSAAAAAPAPRLAWAEPAHGWLALCLLNALLRVVTLGVYHFWGKTEVRQRIWAAVRVDGEPLEYRGTGVELLRGFLVVFGLILLPLSIAGLVLPLLLHGLGPVDTGFNTLAWVFLLMLSGVGLHRARRYRLSRTAFRGIRGGLAGPSTPFAWTYVWTLALVPLTLGWIYPYRALLLHRRLTQSSRFGDAPFAFTGTAGALYRRFWVVWLAAAVLMLATVAAVGAIAGVVTPTGLRHLPWQKIAIVLATTMLAYFLFGLIYAWYAAGRLNYFASRTSLAGVPFKLQATVPSLLWLTASNFLLRVLTLGVLSPLADARFVRYIVQRLSLERPVAWAHIAQNPDALLKRGEGLAEALNVDAF